MRLKELIRSGRNFMFTLTGHVFREDVKRVLYENYDATIFYHYFTAREDDETYETEMKTGLFGFYGKGARKEGLLWVWSTDRPLIMNSSFKKEYTKKQRVIRNPDTNIFV